MKCNRKFAALIAIPISCLGAWFFAPRVQSSPVSPITAVAATPQNGKISFTSYRDGSEPDIYLVSSDGSGLINITNHVAREDYATFSPDGKKIAFDSFRTNDLELFVINSDGSGEPINITNCHDS